jgi:TfoX/Sxy family transcriptional regulator of competence genes
VSSDLDFIEYVIDQMEGAGVITYKPMFGGHTVYCQGKVVALICDNQLFVKPTRAGRNFIGDVVEAPAYPGARLSFLIEEELEDKEWISQLIKLTEKELPMPKPKKKTKKKSRKKPL